MKLTSNQRKFLEAMANRLKPIVRIGKQGMEAKIIDSVKDAFNARELIKIKILDSADVTPQEVADAAVAGTGASLVGIVGRVIILYRAFSEKPPRIELPQPKK
jgi:RNA-binding protein